MRAPNRWRQTRGCRTGADYLRMTLGETPRPERARAVETYLSLTADHGFNASTFTARVITSTGADVGGAMAGALAALSGPLHGGAPSRVLDMLEAIGRPDDAEAWVTAELAAGRKIMGFGHAVYRAADPRSETLREVALELGGDLVERAAEIESRLLAFLAGWRPGAVIVTNVEYYAAVVLHLAGLPQEAFTPHLHHQPHRRLGRPPAGTGGRQQDHPAKRPLHRPPPPAHLRARLGSGEPHQPARVETPGSKSGSITKARAGLGTGGSARTAAEFRWAAGRH